MTATGPGIFENDAAAAWVATLREAQPTAVGDLVSNAVRAVAQAEQPLTADGVQQALAALALMLSGFDAEVLDGAPDQDAVLAWFADLEIELNPARRLVAGAAIERILLPQDNGWTQQWQKSGDQAAALATVHRLRDLLADSSADD